MGARRADRCKDRTFFFTSGDVLRSDVAISARRSDPHAAVHRLHEGRTGPNNVSTYVIEHVPGVVHAPIATSGRPASCWARRCSGSDADRVAGRSDSVQPAGHRRGHVQHDIAAQGPAVDGARRSQLQRGQAIASTARSTGRRVDKVLFGDPGRVSRLQHDLADQQHALQHELDAHLVADMLNEASFSWVRVYGNLPLNPRPDVPGIQVTGIDALPDDVGAERVRAEQLRVARRRHLDAWRAQLKIGGALHARARRQRGVASVQPPDLHVQQRVRLRGRSPAARTTWPSIRRTGGRPSPTPAAATARSRSRRSSRTTGRSNRISRSAGGLRYEGVPEHLRRGGRHDRASSSRTDRRPADTI